MAKHYPRTVIDSPFGPPEQAGVPSTVNVYDPRTDKPLQAANYGTTANRPSSPNTGECYFDTTLGYPVWYTGAAWVDATGAGA